MINRGKQNLLENFKLANTIPFAKNKEFIYGYMRVHMPYTMKKIEGNMYLPLNRDYLPLGYSTFHTEPVDYEDYSHMAINKNDFNLIDEYFYDDGCKPWDNIKNFKAYKQIITKTFFSDYPESWLDTIF
ncbi:hypothetical protein UFOVP1655_109 [uncultured Caudovirales phage]|uniref:Uncharacterized protein n=1 Tax=uncultured Caudovirales phage TaxID=2100421 RepID=A0A6J5T4I6_9CAUD|nr:hypothetical protein UFOVP1655_109 [uncultured Caudovirales phage]